MNPKNVSIDIRRCRCHAYQDVLRSMGFMMTPDNPNANIVWWDGSIPVEEFNSIKPEQHVNKIPGMDYLCYKSILFNSLNQMQSLYPNYYNFFPKTYLLPQQFQEFQKEHQKSIARNESNFLRSRNRHSNYFQFRISRTKTPSLENSNKNLKDDTKVKDSENNEKEQTPTSISTSASAPNPTPTLPSDLPSINMDEPEPPTWIVKPRSGCCGAGIRLIQNSFELAHDSTPSIVQKYVHPFLIDGHKFDFRFYLLITDLQPLSLFIYNEGIARFCTEKYEPPTRKNLNDKFIHITNTAINVENKNLKGEEFEFTRLASSVLKSIEQINPEKGGDVLWSKIKRISILTILALYPEIMSSVKNVCGEVIVDENINNDIDSFNISRNRRKSSVNNSNDKPLTANSRKQNRRSSVNPTLFSSSATIRAKTVTIKSPETSSSSLIRPSLNHQLSQQIKSQDQDNNTIKPEPSQPTNSENNKITETQEDSKNQQVQNDDETSNKLSNNTKPTLNDTDSKTKTTSTTETATSKETSTSSDDDDPPSQGKKDFFVARSPIHRFFHLLGIDVMIDENCNPIVLELNDNPSMKISFPIEKKLKPQLLKDEMSIVTLDGSYAPQKAIEKTGWNVLISPPSLQENETDDKDVDRHLNSLIRSIQQRSMNIFGPSSSSSSNLTKRNQRNNPRTANSKTRYNSQQKNNSALNTSSSLSQNSLSEDSAAKNENKTKLEPLSQPKKPKQNKTTPMAASCSKVTRSIVHPKVKYSVSTEKTVKLRRTGYPRYYYQ